MYIFLTLYTKHLNIKSSQNLQKENKNVQTTGSYNITLAVLHRTCLQGKYTDVLFLFYIPYNILKSNRKKGWKPRRRRERIKPSLPRVGSGACKHTGSRQGISEKKKETSTASRLYEELRNKCICSKDYFSKQWSLTGESLLGLHSNARKSCLAFSV